MVERTENAPGTPSWADIGTDVAAAKAFYGALFGWDPQDAGPPEETGGYGFFVKGGKLVAGYGPQQNPGPPFWSTYIAVADADATTKEVEAAGGTVVMPPMDVMTAGRMAIFQDPQGAFISVWQAGDHKGAQVVNEPGAVSWNELQARDATVAKAFYAAVFGWSHETHEGDMPYTEFKVEGQSIAGLMPVPSAVPSEVPSHWLVYFGVDDVDAAVGRASDLGAAVLAPAMDFPGGRFAVVADPQGAPFGLLRMSQ
jgi:predicted enzyme related to lactoylglutathione lyase